MKLTINSTKYGKEIEFSRPGNHYIYVDLNGKPGSLGNQICYGGGCTGDTIGYSGDDDEKFEKICRRWWKSHLYEMKKEGIDPKDIYY